MMKNLIIVESPNKIKTIEKILGSDYKVMASRGHIRDLATKEMSIDIPNGYEPQYIIPEDKRKIVSELQKAVKAAEMVWLASDVDREGEAISWHLQEALNLDGSKTKRIVFNEITEPAILHAIENPRAIDMSLVDAQQARRVLDRLVGYEISPILWSKIKQGLSAGRVQSVSVRLIVERAQEIQEFQPKGYFKVTAVFETAGSPQHLVAELLHHFDTEQEANAFLESIVTSQFQVSKLETRPAHRSPTAPFTTSTLQQEAGRKLGFSVARTMQIAQQLYEEGYITYMRTDSVNLSEMALAMAKETITEMYGSQYVKIRHYQTKIKGAQEAHEAIRPTNMANATINAEPAMKHLYELIWKRTIASQMSDAELEKTTLEIAISGSNDQFVCKGEQVLFDGFLKVYRESTDDDMDTSDDERLLPKLAEGTVLNLLEASAMQHYTLHPPRYTEMSLVKKLEELGIGRPSTYAPTISTILKREYVIKEDREPVVQQRVVLTLKSGVVSREERPERTGAERNKLFPTDIGNEVVKFMKTHFSDVIEYNFTADVEKDFDDIAEGKKDWRKVIDQFYKPFHQNIEITRQNSQRSKGERLLGTDPATGKCVYAKIGRYGTMVQIGDASDEEKPAFASMDKGQSIATITLEEALALFALPRTVGTFEGSDVIVSKGKYGPYTRHSGKFYSLGKGDDPKTVSLERCIEIIKTKRIEEAEKEELRKKFPHDIGEYEDAMIQSNVGRFGPYLTYNGANYKLPKGSDPLTISLPDAIAIIKEAVASPSKPRTRRSAAK
ncbi:MAG: type I DNA topoisomerase [Bacteroidales bacterium]|nr:type I DNA topoisomerase [Candidatus Colimorpha onthohippi]